MSDPGACSFYGQILIDGGLLTQEQIDEACHMQETVGGKLTDVLVKLGYATTEEIQALISSHLDIPYVKLTVDMVDPEAAKLIPAKVAMDHMAIPVTVVDNILTIAVCDPVDTFSLDVLAFASGYELEPITCDEVDIRAAIEHYFKDDHSLVKSMEEAPGELLEFIDRFEEEPEEKPGIDEGPVVKLVNLILSRAIKERASDIYIEPEENLVRVRCNIDGRLSEISVLPGRVHGALVSRIKVLSELDIAERRRPQDGAFFVKYGDKHVDFRVASAPTVYGESMTLRVLDQGNAMVSIGELGLPDADLSRLKAALEEPYGFVLVCGPTGSGKTTTLYAMLNQISDPTKKVITIEDPVEYRLNSMTQIPVAHKIGLDFAAILRSVLRHNPNIIMVGEIRDGETAGIAVQAAMTGHLMLSSLHTVGAAEALPRLMDMGVEPYLVREVVKVVLAQRLIRRLCPACREEYTADDSLLSELGIETATERPLYRAKGCERCKYTGYSGRVGVFEMLTMNDELRRCITPGMMTGDVKGAAESNGMVTMWRHALRMVVEGETSIEEVIRNVPR